MRRPESHRTGELGEIRVAQLFTEFGWVVTKVQSDYGIDLIIQRTEGSFVTGDFALVQVKATRRFSKPPSAGVASISLSRSHLHFWQSISVPTFLAVVRLPASDAFILDCHALSLQLAQQDNGANAKTHRVIIPEAALMGSERMADLARCVQLFWSSLRQTRKIPASISFSSAAVATTCLIGVAPIPILGGPVGALLGGVVGALFGGHGTVAGSGDSRLIVKLQDNLSPILGSDLAEKLISGAFENV